MPAVSPSPGLVRLRIDLAYDGTGFSGWAAQPGRRTVESTLVSALATALRSREPLRLTVAGRTDAGVHARGQVAHVDVCREAWQALSTRRGLGPPESLVARLQGLLADDLAVRSVREAPDGFDARFGALRRHYRYRLVDTPAAVDPLRRADTVRVRRALDVERMDRAVAPLVGLHEFAAFCRRREGATTVRALQQYRWRRGPDGVVTAVLSADAFCHSMVRALVGAAVAVGDSSRGEDFPAEVLRARRRDPRVRVMPAHGLTLEGVDYPPDEELADRARQARARREPPAEPGQSRRK